MKSEVILSLSIREEAIIIKFQNTKVNHKCNNKLEKDIY